MYCIKCGSENNSGSKFCRICGTPLIDPEQPETNRAGESVGQADHVPLRTPDFTSPPRKSWQDKAKDAASKVASGVKSATTGVKSGVNSEKLKKYLPVAGGALAVIIVAIVLIAVLSGGKGGVYYRSKDYRDLVYDNSSEKFIAFTVTGDTTATGYDRISDAVYSADGSVALISGYVDVDDDDTPVSLIKGGKVTRIADDADSIAISDDGSTIAYFVADDDSLTGELYVCDAAKGVSKLISDEAIGASFVFSPSGDRIAFSTCDPKKSDDYYGYISTMGGELTELGKNNVPIMLSNGAKYVYYYKFDPDYSSDEAALYGTASGETRKLGKLDLYTYASYSISFNRDRTEMLFNDSEGRSYITKKCGEPESVSKYSVNYVILGSDVQKSYVWFGDVNCTVCGVDTFVGKFAAMDGYTRIGRISSDYHAETVLKDYETCAVSRDCRSIAMTDEDGDLYLLSKASDKKYEPKPIAKGADANIVYANADLKYIYYGNDDGELYFISNKGKSSMVSDECYYAVVDDKGVCLFKTASEKGDVMASVRGKAPVRIDDYDDDCSLFRYLSTTGYMIIEYNDDGTSSSDIFMGSGTTFKPVAEDVDKYSY